MSADRPPDATGTPWSDEEVKAEITCLDKYERDVATLGLDTIGDYGYWPDDNLRLVATLRELLALRAEVGRLRARERLLDEVVLDILCMRERGAQAVARVRAALSVPPQGTREKKGTPEEGT